PRDTCEQPLQPRNTRDKLPVSHKTPVIRPRQPRDTRDKTPVSRETPVISPVSHETPVISPRQPRDTRDQPPVSRDTREQPPVSQYETPRDQPPSATKHPGTPVISPLSAARHHGTAPCQQGDSRELLSAASLFKRTTTGTSYS
ncbi:lysine-rich arabinogalactan protein 19-like, partial [Homarus americanus]|uniref:lysine-rich arabinogalactan protein 19-like n=1 Tax=Homarus americanus TaxID=6706 RepID=UPI001C456112